LYETNIGDSLFLHLRAPLWLIELFILNFSSLLLNERELICSTRFHVFCGHGKGGIVFIDVTKGYRDSM